MEKPTQKQTEESLKYIFELAYFGLSEQTTSYKKDTKIFNKHKRRIIYLYNLTKKWKNQ